MTIKRFLLDLLDAKEFEVRHGTDAETAKNLAEMQIARFASWKQILLTDIDRARAWVERGTEES